MEVVRIKVRGGEIVDAGSWLYVWRHADDGRVVYVGSTDAPPALRTWLHLHGDDPAIARVRHRYGGAMGEALDVVAFRLPDHVAGGRRRRSSFASSTTPTCWPRPTSETGRMPGAPDERRSSQASWPRSFFISVAARTSPIPRNRGYLRIRDWRVPRNRLGRGLRTPRIHPASPAGPSDPQ